MEVPDAIRESAGILDGALRALEEIEAGRDDVLAEAELCHLYDMAEDASESFRQERAEAGLLDRQA